MDVISLIVKSSTKTFLCKAKMLTDYNFSRSGNREWSFGCARGMFLPARTLK